MGVREEAAVAIAWERDHQGGIAVRFVQGPFCRFRQHEFRCRCGHRTGWHALETTRLLALEHMTPPQEHAA